MKSLSKITLLLGVASLSSCALSGEHQAETKEDEPISGSIPPPSGLPASETMPAPDSLPEIETTGGPDGDADPTEKLIKSGGFIFRDPTKDLPKSQDLAAPASSIPAPKRIENSSETDSEDQPLVLQP